jgi:DNA-directed RNA polymerase subunit H (RpoH/RPB5)
MYQNISEKFLKYRNLTPKQTDQINMVKDTFIEKIQQKGYIVINTTDQNKNHVTIVLVKENTEYATKAVALESLVKALDYTTGDKMHHLMIISEGAVNTVIKNKIDALHTNNSKRMISMYPYDVFKVVLPESVKVPPHRILPAEEAQMVLQQLKCEKTSLPKILVTEPIMIWIGAKVGDIIEITRFSQNTKESIAYRIVI